MSTSVEFNRKKQRKKDILIYQIILCHKFIQDTPKYCPKSEKMGKKKSSQSASVSTIASKSPSASHAPRENVTKKLSQQKRNELNQLADYMLKLGFDSTVTVNELWTQYNEIETNLQRIQSIESELKNKTAIGKNRLAAVERFTEWARANGATFDGISIQQFPQYEFGLMAQKNFQRNELFIQIPKKMILTLDNLSEVAVEVIAQMPVLDTMPNVKLAVALVIEKLRGNASFFKSYLDLLPERYSTVMYFTPNEMNELRGSSAFVMALNQCKHIARQYAFIRKAIQSLKTERPDSMLAILKERFTYDLYW